MNWMYRIRTWIFVSLLFWAVLACQKQTPIEESAPSSLSPSAQTIAEQPVAEPTSVQTDDPAKQGENVVVDTPKDKGNSAVDDTSPDATTPPKSSETQKELDSEASLDSEDVKPVPFASKSSKEKWDLTLKIATYEGCLAVFQPDEFLRKKFKKELYDWFQVSPEEVDEHQRVLLSSDAEFVRVFNERRKACPDTYVDFIVQRTKACFAYCERLQECGDTGRSGCVSRCESWRSLSAIFRQFSCIGLSKCAAVTQCVAGADKREKWLKDANTMRRKTQLLNPDRERQRLLNAISSMVCASEDVRKNTSLLIDFLVQNGFNRPAYEAAVNRLQSDATFAEDLYDRTRACIPHDTPPAWPVVGKPKKKNVKSKAVAP